MPKANWSIKACTPSECDEKALEKFHELVVSGGEVNPRGLPKRIKDAEKLIFLYDHEDLAGIGALKSPDPNYRDRIASAAKARLPEAAYPFELGWVFVSNEFRGQGYATRIAKRILVEAHGAGMFATTHSENMAMRNVLERTKFVAVGERYRSTQKDRLIQLFVRKSSRPQVH